MLIFTKLFAITLTTAEWLAVGGLTLSIITYISQQFFNRRQRKLELRWKQAEAAKKILDEMLSSSLAKSAMRLLDGYPVEFTPKQGTGEIIVLNHFPNVLAIDDNNFSEKELFIRKSFDSLFYYLAMMEHSVSNNLVLYEDVCFPIDYYMGKINQKSELSKEIQGFLNYHNQKRTADFMKRFEKHSSNSLISKEKKV